jgi:hypothetical protein
VVEVVSVVVGVYVFSKNTATQKLQFWAWELLNSQGKWDIFSMSKREKMLEIFNKMIFQFVINTNLQWKCQGFYGA